MLDDRGVEVAVAGLGLEDVVDELPQVHVGEAGDAVGQREHVGVVATQRQHGLGEVERAGLGAAHDRVTTEREGAARRVVDQLEVAAGLGEPELVELVVDPVVVVEEVGRGGVRVRDEAAGGAVAGAPGVGELVVEVTGGGDRAVVLVGRHQGHRPGDGGVGVVAQRRDARQTEQAGRIQPAAGAGLGGAEALDDRLAALLRPGVVLVDRALGVLHQALAEQRTTRLGVHDHGVGLVDALDHQGGKGGAAALRGRERDPADVLRGAESAGLEDLVAALRPPRRDGGPRRQVRAQGTDGALQRLGRGEVEGAEQTGGPHRVTGVAHHTTPAVDDHGEDRADARGHPAEGLGIADDGGADLRQLVVTDQLEPGDVAGREAERRGVLGQPLPGDGLRRPVALAAQEAAGDLDAARGPGGVPGHLGPSQGPEGGALRGRRRHCAVACAGVEGQRREQLPAQRQDQCVPRRDQQVAHRAGGGGRRLRCLRERGGRDEGGREACQRDLAGEEHVGPLGVSRVVVADRGRRPVRVGPVGTR